MRINLLPFENSENQILSLCQHLKLPSDVLVDVGYDSIHGINEMARSLALLHPHKMSIATLGRLPQPLCDVVAKFKSEGYAVQEIPVTLSQNQIDLKPSFDSLKKDTLLVLASAMEPLTGFHFPIEEARALATSKNIFFITYWGRGSFTSIPKLSSPWEGHILDPLWSEEVAPVLLLKGERMQGERLLWGTPQWHKQTIQRLAKALDGVGKQEQDQKAVLSFEAEVSDMFSKFASGLGVTARSYDRAVLFFSGLSGDALKVQLLEKGYETQTGSACSWGRPASFEWLLGLGVSEAQAEGSLVIPMKNLKDRQFLDSLKEVVTFSSQAAGI